MKLINLVTGRECAAVKYGMSEVGGLLSILSSEI